MSDIKFTDIDKLYAQSVLDSKCEEGQKTVYGINRLIRQCQREYDKLSDTLHKSELVKGISTAVGFISSMALMPSEYTQVENATDLIQTPAGKVVLGLAIGSFAVAGISGLVNNKISNQMGTNLDRQEELYDELKFHEEILTANENVQAINQIKTAIHGEDVSISGESKYGYDAQLPSGIAGSLPRIVVIDEQKDFLDLPPNDLGQ